MKARTLGYPIAEHEKYEQRQRGKTEKPTPAQCGHHKYGEEYFKACACGPEYVAQDEAFGAMFGGQEFDKQCG